MRTLMIAVMMCALIGCSGSTGAVVQAETTPPDAGVDDASRPTADASDAGDVPDDAGELAPDAADALAPAPDDAAPPVQDAARPVVDAGPPKCLKAKEDACAASAGIAEDGCGSYYQCKATCGLSVPGAGVDAGVVIPPDGPWPCTWQDGTTAGWRYACGSVATMPVDSCEVIVGNVSCCKVPTNGNAFR